MKGVQFKEKTIDRVCLWRAALAPAVWRQAGLEALKYAALSFGLSGLGLFGEPLPVAACLVLCAGQPLHMTGILFGAMGGYILLWGWELAMEPLALSLSCFVGAALFHRTPVSRWGLCAGLCVAVGGIFLLDTGLGLLPLGMLAARTAVAALVPQIVALLRRTRSGAGPMAEKDPLSLELTPQKQVERALQIMHGVLAREDPILQPIRLAEVYDEAAERVCHCCVRHGLCWEQNAEDTYRDLCAAGELILARGEAQREDFPTRFTERCCHTAGFLTAVNQAMDGLMTRRREEHRRAEGQRVAAGQYLALERLLVALSRPVPEGKPVYAPELAVGCAGRAGSEISGDRGSAFQDRFGNYCILLCDGMGSGMAARVESDRATRLLRAFLESGMEADAAMGLLNGFYVLRKQSAFSTMDLLRLDLRTGAARLYKWGAAPSYLRREEVVEELGTATPPPGLKAARRVPEQYELSLAEGETLVMVSDGVYGPQAATRLKAFAQGSVRDLAACLIAREETDTEDDRTAVVLRLRQAKAAGMAAEH